MTGTPSATAFTYDELDAILRGAGGHDGAIGMSAIDGLIAALVAAPTFVHPDEWVPLIFGGRRPRMAEGSPEERAVRTVFNRYNEVSTTLAEQPHAYRPIFMIDQDGSVVARDWAVGFMLGIGLRSHEWAGSILLTEHRSLLTPILVYHDPGDGLLPDMPPAEKRHPRAGRGPLPGYPPRRKAPPSRHGISTDPPGRCRHPRHLQSTSRCRSATSTEYAAALVANKAVASNLSALTRTSDRQAQRPGWTTTANSSAAPASLDRHAWRQHCR